MTDADESMAKARAVLDRFMAALNANDAAGVNDAFNFPHIRFASGKITTFAKRGDFKMETFRVRVDGDGWAKSAWDPDIQLAKLALYQLSYAPLHGIITIFVEK